LIETQAHRSTRVWSKVFPIIHRTGRLCNTRADQLCSISNHQLF